MATLLDGKATSAAIKEELKENVNTLISNGKAAPHLVAVLVGNNPASRSYVGNKIKFCAEVGFKSTLIELADDTSEKALLAKIEELNSDEGVDGYIIQLPLPKHISEEKVIKSVDPDKDVDGFHVQNVGKMVAGMDTYLPATPYGITKIMDHYGLSASGKKVVVLGRSHIVGRPISILLSQSRSFGNGTVTVCHSRTQNLKEICQEADIIVAAIGIPNFLKADMVKKGAIIIDVGINRVEDASRKRGFRLVGDVDFAAVEPIASHITPVPGGVGPMTIAGLMLNTYKSALNRN